jgi:hypothetical protein
MDSSRKMIQVAPIRILSNTKKKKKTQPKQIEQGGETNIIKSSTKLP